MDRLPKVIKIDGSKSKLVVDYYNDMALRFNELQQNISPYDETTDRATGAIANIDDELDKLYERIHTLEAQRTEYEGVIYDANKSRSAIIDAHTKEMAEINSVFFQKLGKEAKVKELLDEKASWDIDLQYMETFGLMFIREVLPEEGVNIADDDDMSDWMSNINKPE